MADHDRNSADGDEEHRIDETDSANELPFDDDRGDPDGSRPIGLTLMATAAILFGVIGVFGACCGTPGLVLSVLSASAFDAMQPGLGEAIEDAQHPDGRGRPANASVNLVEARRQVADLYRGYFSISMFLAVLSFAVYGAFVYGGIGCLSGRQTARTLMLVAIGVGCVMVLIQLVVYLNIASGVAGIAAKLTPTAIAPRQIDLSPITFLGLVPTIVLIVVQWLIMGAMLWYLLRKDVKELFI